MNKQKRIEQLLLTICFIILSFFCGYFCSNNRIDLLQNKYMIECNKDLSLNCGQSCYINTFDSLYTYNLILTKTCK